MPASVQQDRSRLDGFELEVFEAVRLEATPEQWREWLRVPLEHAATKGDINLFTRLMDAGADGSAGYRGCFGRTLLGAAAYGQNEEMVLALLKAGAQDDVNVKFGSNRESALHNAACFGAAKVCRVLLGAGANPNILGVSNHTPLHLAAQNGHHEVVNILMLGGADPNSKTAMEIYRVGAETPLHLAVLSGHELCVSTLLEGGADIDSRNSDGATPLTVGASTNNLAVVEQLLAAGANVDIGTRGAFDALGIAAKRGNASIVRALLASGISASSSDSNGYTALHAAADISDDGYRALHAAADGDEPDRNRGDAIRLLLEAGADTEAETIDRGLTPLHVAVLGDMYRMRICASPPRGTTSSAAIHSLLEGGANVNARGKGWGRTPLYIACSFSKVGTVELLLRWGADEKLIGREGETAEDVVGRGSGHFGSKERFKADNQRILQLLARAPADRSWRRRRWLVLARSCPCMVQLATDSDSGGSGGSGGCYESGGGGGGTRGKARTDLARLVGRVVNLDIDGIFRLVVAFL